MGTVFQVLMLALVVAIATVSAQSRNDYCRLCSQHTMCLYSGVSRRCGRVSARGVSERDKSAIVAMHNAHRSKVARGQERLGNPGPQPPAADMMQLVWDNELAAIAQRWVEQCAWGHDSCRNVRRYSVGQNLYMSMGSNPNDLTASWRNAIDGWYNEVRLYSRNDINPFRFDMKTGHYTQLVWAKTRAVGCGYIVFHNPKRPSHPFTKYYACNYGPSGNVVRQALYHTGRACTRCPGRSCSNGLCVP